MGNIVWWFALLAAAGVAVAWWGATARVYARLAVAEKRRPTLQDRLTAAEIPLTTREFLTVGLGLGAGLGLLATVIMGPSVLSVALCMGGPLVYWQYWAARMERFRDGYVKSLDKSVEIFLRAYTTNPNLRQALQEAAPYMPPPAQGDFLEIAGALGAHEDLSTALYRVAARRQNPYFDMLTEALATREQLGGSLREVLVGVRELMQGIIQIRGQVRARQTQPRLEGLIIAVAPFVFLLLLKVALAPYEAGFYQTFDGQLVLVGVLVLSGLSYYLAQRIANAGMDVDGGAAARRVAG